MQPIIKTILALGLLLLATACGGGGPEALKKEGNATAREMVSVFESIQDKASAEAAIPKLEKLTETMKDIDARAKAMSEEDQAIFNAEDETMKELGPKLAGEVARIMSNPELMPIMTEIMTKMAESE